MNSNLYKALQESYIEETGLQQGDVVEVNDNHSQIAFGWANVWDDQMTSGSILTFVKNEGSKGLKMSDGMDYPFYAIDKVQGAKTSSTDFDYNIISFENRIYLNGNEIDKETLDRIKQELETL